MKPIILSAILLFAIQIPVFSQDQNASTEPENIDNQTDSNEAVESESPSPNKSFTLDPMGNQKPRTEVDLPEEEVINEGDEANEEGYSYETSAYEDEMVYEGNDPADDIQTLQRGKYHNGFFGAVSFKATEFNNKDLVMMGVRGGWIANRSVAIGFEGYGIIPTAEYADIDSYYSSRAVGGYGGMFIEPILFSNKLLHVTFPVSSGAGWLGYVYDWEHDYYDDSDLIDGDVFWYVEPGAGVEINVSKAFRIHTGATYRFTQDLQLINTSDKAFSGWNYFITFKFGRF